jgi:hypothetical protein
MKDRQAGPVYFLKNVRIWLKWDDIKPSLYLRKPQQFQGKCKEIIALKQAWWYTPAIPVLGRLREEDEEIEAILGT